MFWNTRIVIEWVWGSLPVRKIEHQTHSFFFLLPWTFWNISKPEKKKRSCSKLKTNDGDWVNWIEGLDWLLNSSNKQHLFLTFFVCVGYCSVCWRRYGLCLFIFSNRTFSWKRKINTLYLIWMKCSWNSFFPYRSSVMIYSGESVRICGLMHQQDKIILYLNLVPNR